MLSIGLTGGIGSGKSTVARVFEVLGIPVYYADMAAKELMNSDPALREALISTFGRETYTGNTLNRSYLSALVFADPYKLEQLNALVHPVTIDHAAAWFAEQQTPYAIKEAALLFESGASAHLDFIIGVTAPAALRIKRVMDRDQLTREEVQRRMNRQVEDVIKMKLCDAVIHNDEQQAVLPQVLALHEQLLTLSQQKAHA